jgi:hypothetical protein
MREEEERERGTAFEGICHPYLSCHRALQNGRSKEVRRKKKIMLTTIQKEDRAAR